MKQYLSLKFFTISVLFAAALAGCSATTSGPNGTQAEGSMIATVNGQAWSSTVVPAISGGATALFNTPVAGAITVTGVSVSLSGTQTIAIALLHPHLGADSLGTGNTGTFSYGTPGQDSYVTAGFGAGSINITKYDTLNRQISGTFNFTARQVDTLTHVVTVTNGSFVDVEWSK